MNKLVTDYDVFFLDLDGTLVDDKKSDGSGTISPENRHALQALLDQKKHFVLSTGRIGANAKKYLDEVNAQYAVLGNGSQVYVKGKIVIEHKITKQQILKLFEFARKRHLVFRFDDEYKAYGVFNLVQSFITKRYNFVAQQNYDFDMGQERYKMVMWGKNKFSLGREVAKLQSKFPDLSIVTSNHGWTIEITNAKATKGHGNAYLIDHVFKVSKERTIHFGDTMNDSTVKGHVGKLVVMRNGENKLKKLADLIGPHYRPTGIADVINGEFELRLPK